MTLSTPWSPADALESGLKMIDSLRKTKLKAFAQLRVSNRIGIQPLPIQKEFS